MGETCTYKKFISCHSKEAPFCAPPKLVKQESVLMQVHTRNIVPNGTKAHPIMDELMDIQLWMTYSFKASMRHLEWWRLTCQCPLAMCCLYINSYCWATADKKICFVVRKAFSFPNLVCFLFNTIYFKCLISFQCHGKPRKHISLTNSVEVQYNTTVQCNFSLVKTLRDDNYTLVFMVQHSKWLEIFPGPSPRSTE